jgi:putative ATPase
MKEMGYAKGYQHAHRNENALTDMRCLPEPLENLTFYNPSDRGFEAKLSERLEWIKKNREESVVPTD